ncbi:hypothetical protein KW805_00875 [Candidatus Pacearchaeota archaeon]|nr:hypothetical protein [Candidatus Pacearchaeota archaeon]
MMKENSNNTKRQQNSSHGTSNNSRAIRSNHFGGQGNKYQINLGDGSTQYQAIPRHVPERQENPWTVVLSKLIEKIGLKASLWFLGVIGTIFAGYGGYEEYMGIKSTIHSTMDNPLTLLNPYYGFVGILFAAGVVMLISCLFIVVNRKIRCNNCGKYFRVVEQGDGEIVSHGLNGHVKVKRTYSCACAARPWEVISWENHAPEQT